jgi:hypothetical protein
MFGTLQLVAEPVAEGKRAVVRPLLDAVSRNVGFLVTIGLAIAYLPPLFRTLWVDEAGTFWMARGGPLSAIAKTWHWPGQSLLYSFIASFFCFDGFPLRDLLLRVPSLIGAAAACYFVFRLAEGVFGPGAGKIASVLFVFHPATIDFATQARPYALGMAAVAASFWTLFRWNANRGRAWLVAWVLFSTLILYLHYMFAIVLGLEAVFLIMEMRRREDWSCSGELLTAGAAIGLLTAPILPHLVFLARVAHTLPFTAKPNAWELSGFLAPSLLLCGLVGSAAVVHFLGGYDSESCKISLGQLVMMFAWWTGGPLLLFGISTFTSLQMFVPRYMSYSGPGLVLLLTWAAFSAFGPRAGLIWAVLGVIATTANPLSLLRVSQPGWDELGPVVQLIESASANSGELPPVLFRSELPESDFYNWRAGNAPESYLYTPFAAYPIKNRLVPLPYRLTAEIKEHIVSLIAADLKNTSKVIFVTRDPLWIPWVEDQFERAGFTYKWIQPNSFFVVAFERRHAVSGS